MKLKEIIEIARNELDDNVAPYLWSDANIVAYTNKAINELCTKAKIVSDASTAAITQIAVVVGTKDYRLDSRVVEVRRARLSSQSRQLRKRSVAYMDNNKPGWESDSAGTPTMYLTDSTTGYITLHTTPDAEDTLLMTVFRLPLTQLSVDDLEVEPEIHMRYHDEIVDGILGYAYSKQDTETFDPVKAERYKELWRQKILDIANNTLIDNSVDTNIDPNNDYMDEYA